MFNVLITIRLKHITWFWFMIIELRWGDTRHGRQVPISKIPLVASIPRYRCGIPFFATRCMPLSCWIDFKVSCFTSPFVLFMILYHLIVGIFLFLLMNISCAEGILPVSNIDIRALQLWPFISYKY